MFTQKTMTFDYGGKKYDVADIQEFIDTMNEDGFQFERPTAMDQWLEYGFVKKDVSDGDVIKVLNLKGCNGTEFYVKCENGAEYKLTN